MSRPLDRRLHAIMLDQLTRAQLELGKAVYAGHQAQLTGPVSDILTAAASALSAAYNLVLIAPVAPAGPEAH